MSLTVAQEACALVGINPITSFTDGSKEANVLNTIYEPLVKAEIAAYPWRFAMQQEQLTRVSDLDDDAPISRWDSAYPQPATALRITGMFINDSKIEYDRYGAFILCQATEQDTVICEFLIREVEANWSSTFRLLIVYRLAAVLASSIMYKGDVADAWNKQANWQMRTARNNDSQQQSNRFVQMTRLLSQRKR
jgi:hypothetical protein